MDQFFDRKPLSWIHSYIVNVVKDIYLHPTNLIKRAQSSDEIMSNINKPYKGLGLPYMNIFRRAFYFLQLLYKLEEKGYEGCLLEQRNMSTFINFAKERNENITSEINILNSWKSYHTSDTDLLAAFVSILLKVYPIEKKLDREFRIEVDEEVLITLFPRVIEA